MPQQDARKNYIGIVSDTTEEERVADDAARVQPHVVATWSAVSRPFWHALARMRRNAPPWVEAASFHSFKLDNETFV